MSTVCSSGRNLLTKVVVLFHGLLLSYLEALGLGSGEVVEVFIGGGHCLDGWGREPTDRRLLEIWRGRQSKRGQNVEKGREKAIEKEKY